MLSRALALALALPLPLAACGWLERPSDTGAVSGSYSDWSGAEAYYYGYSQSQDELSCTLYWAVNGTPTVGGYCPECQFTFDLDFTYDADSSTDDGTCSALQADFSFTYAYAESLDPYDPYPGTTGAGYIGTFYTGEFTVLGYATFDSSTGRLDYSWGEEDPYSGYGYGYYTDLRVGTATVQ